MCGGPRDLVSSLLACAIALVATGLWLADGLAAGDSKTLPLRVFFMGNSYTYVNDLPGTFVSLAASGRHEVKTRMDAAGGELVQGHANDVSALAALRETRWDYVVLQEQSEVPAVDLARSMVMYPAARRLAAAARAAGATPVFLMTWAHAHGLSNPILDNATMQARIGQAYVGIARDMHAPVAPVGLAWQQVHRQYPKIALRQSDGSHPTIAGTYLAACVLYAALLGASREGLPYTAGRARGTALRLQAAAAQTVLATAGRWDFR